MGRRNQLYKNLINSKAVTEYALGTENEFISAMSSPEKAGKIYDNLINKTKLTAENIGTREQFIDFIAPDFGNTGNKGKQDNIFSEEYLEQVAEPSNDFLSKMANPLETPFSQYIDETISGKQKVEIPYLDSWGKVKKAGQEYEKQKEAEKLYRQSIDNETDRIQDEINKLQKDPGIRRAMSQDISRRSSSPLSYSMMSRSEDTEMTSQEDYLNLKTAASLISDAKKTANASKNKSGFWKGVGDSLISEEAVSLGLSSIENTLRIMLILDKVEKEGIQSLTPSENTLLEAASVKSLSDMIYESGLSTLYNVGSATGTSIPYMLQFVITHAPASAIAKPVMKKLTGYVTKRFGEAAIKKAAARAISTLPKVGTKTALKTANALTKNGVAALEAGATGALMPIIQPSMYNDILERRIGQVDADINPQTGKVQYKGQTGEKSWGKSIGEGFTAGAIENLAEMSGGAIMKTLGVPVKALSKVSPKSREFINIISEKPLLRSFNRVREDIAKTTGVHSIPGEALEEFVGQTANALTVGDQKIEDIYTWENAWMTLASVAPLSIGMGSASGVMAQATKKKVVRDYNRASQKLSEAYSPDLVEYIKSRVGGSPEQQAMIIRQYYDRAREAKNEEEKRNIANEYRLVMDYAAAVNNYDAYIGGIEARVANEVSALSEQIRNDINPDMNATVYIDYDGQMARVTSGNIVFDENGDINDSKSDDTITIELQDGTKQMVSPDKFKVTGYRSFDDQINEVTQNIENSILSQEDTDVYGPDPVLDEALYINTDNGPVSVKVTRADYGGFEGIQIDESGKEITEIINGIETPVSIPFSKDQIIRPDNPTIETENNTVAEDARPLQAGDVINVTGFQNPVTFVSESNGDAIVGLLDNMGNPIINTEGKQVQVPVKSEQIIRTASQSGNNTETALSRIPKDKNGNPIYEQAETPDLAWDAIMELTEGDEAMAQIVTNGMVTDKEAALRKLEKAKTKAGVSIEEKIAAERKRKESIEKAKQELQWWKEIAETAKRRNDATGEQIEDGNGTAGRTKGTERFQDDNRGRTNEHHAEQQNDLAQVGEQVELLVSQMRDKAETARGLELTPENWDAEFGEDGMVETPVGKVKMGENQYLKLLKKKRDSYFGMIKPTLTNPDIVLEEYDPKDGAERATKYLFVKTFIKSDGSRYVHFESVTVQKDNLEVSISSHEINKEALMKKVHQDKLIHLNNKLFSSDVRLTEPQKEGSDLVPTPNSVSFSINKDTTFSRKNNELDKKVEKQENTRPKLEEKKNLQILSEEEFIEQNLDNAYDNRVDKALTREDWEDSDEYIQNYNNASDSYPDYINNLRNSGELQSLYDNGNIGQRIKIREAVETAGFNVNEYIDTSKEKAEYKKKRDEKRRIQQIERMKRIGLIDKNNENNVDDIRFRTKETWTPEEKEIITKAKNNGTYLKAPNSADTNLNPRQWVQVRTKAFKKWFGDWENDSENVSKVVDENGEPMVVYHGTSDKSFFHIFDYNKAGTGNDKGLYSRGFYFSPNKRTADAYRGKEGHVYGVYLQLKNPFYINKFKDVNELADYLNVSETIFYEHAHGFTVSPSFAGTLTSSIKEKGHDGVIVIRKNSDIIQEIVAFNPNQIKSATDNTGEFSINNNDIRFRTNMSSSSENLNNETLNNGNKNTALFNIESINDFAGMTPEQKIVFNAVIDMLKDANIPVEVLTNNQINSLVEFQNSRLMTVYHGSGAKFDAFDHSHIGEGEGAQAYGWGSYVTEVEGIGRTYAESNSGNIFKSGFGDFYLQEIRKGLAEGNQFEDIKQKLLSYHADMYEKAGGNIEMYGDFISDYETLQQLKENDLPKRNLYTVEIPDNTGNNYLVWNEEVNETQKEEIISSLSEIYDEDFDFDYFLDKMDQYEYEYNLTGEGLYKLLSKYGFNNNSQKASNILQQIGYTGISYPAQYRTGGRSDGAKNYVIFNENDLKIKDRISFFKDNKGIIYGATINGEIYLNGSALNPETPIHEYTHIWDYACKDNNPELWNRGIKLMKQTTVWEEVKNDPNYSDLQTDDEIASEVHSRLTGKDSTKLMENIVSKASRKSSLEIVKAISLRENLKKWISDFWWWLKDTMSPWTKNKSSKVSLEDFVNMPLKDLVIGTKLNIKINHKSFKTQNKNNLLNNEDNSLSSQNDQKEKNGTISESIPQRKYRTQASQDRRMEEAASGLRNRIEASTRDAQKNSGTLSKRQQQEIEQRSAESYAKETGQWIPISDTFTWQPMPSGNENDVYLNTNDGHVYKVNNLINSKGILPLFDRLILHNQTFPESKYEFVGFTGFDNGNIFPVFRQQYVNNATFATPQEIGEYMQSLGFKQTGDAKYSNGDITISDLRPRNVLKDSDGDLYVVDAEFKAENNSRFRFIGEEGATNLDRSEEATTRLDNLNMAREMENAFEEKKARIEKLRNSEPVEITGEEYKGKYELNRDSAQEFILNNLRGSYTIVDTGEKVNLSKVGAKKVTSHSMGNEAHLKSIVAIPQLLGNAIFIEERPNEKRNGKYDSYRYYVTGLKIGNENFTVRLTIGVKNGKYYYDHYLTEIEKGNLIEIANGFTPTGDAPVPSYTVGEDTRLISLLQTNNQENARKIKLATGWERGADGKWQHDTEAKLQIPKEEKINEIKRLSDILNTEVEIYDTQADLPTNIREKANGEISGYYMPGNDKVAIVLDANISIGDIQATMLHEIVGHKGIRGLFGNRTDEFLDKVFESMDANVRAEYMERFNSERLAAEEYLSELAEYNPETSGIKKIIAIIRDFFREILGIDLKLSDNDIVYILSKSRERLQNSRNLSENKPLNESYSPNEESNLTETNRIFNERLSELTEQNSDNMVLDLGNPSEILLSAGIEDNPMKLYGNKVIKKMKKHGFKLEELRNLPEAVANPIAVFNNYQKDGNRSILTELRTEQGNFLVTLDLGKDADVDFNIVTSVFGKGDNNIIDWINKGYATYIDKKKALGYLHFSERNIPEASNSREMKKGQELLSHQSAPIAATAASSDLVSATNIVKEFENPTIPNKNEAVEKRIQQETEETLYRLKSPVKVDVSGDSAIEAAEKISGAQYLQRVIDKDIYRNISYNTLNRNAIQAVGYGRKKLRYFDKRKMENAYKGLFDNMNDLHNLQKTIIDTYGSIDDSLNAYYAENASSSRAQDRTNRFQVEYEQPLINTLAKIRKKFNNDDFMMKYYPSVRTIIERQKVITDREIKKAQNDPKIKDDRQSLFAAIQLAEKKDYAGQTGTYKEILAHEYPEFKFPANFETMTYDEVKDFAKENNLISMADFVERSENILGNDLVNEFWNNIRKISQYKLYNDYQTGMISRDMFEELTSGVTMKELAKKRLDAGEIKQEQYDLVLNTFNRPESLLSRGIITKDQYNSLKPRYEYYLPLKGTSDVEADDINEYNNKKVKNISALKAVEGHENVARDPLPQLLQDVYGSIMSQEQNRWRNTLLNMLRKYPMPDLYHIQTEYFTPIRNDKGNIIEYVPYVKIVNDKLIFVPTDEELKAKTAIRKRKGLDLDIEINKRQSSEHAVTFLENGDYVTVYFTDPRIAQSINNLNVNTLPTFLDSIMKWGGKINRFRSQFMTTANPEFVIANVIKDFQEANSNILIKEGLKYWKEFNKIYFNPELGAAIRRRLNGKKGDTEIDKYVDEFFKYGGETAYNMLPGYEQKRKDLYKEIKKVNKEGNKAILVGSKVKDWAKDNLEMLNKQAELRARIATYVTSRKHTKREISRSIWDAKEITVNFDKKGSWAKGFGFWQLFWNAGRQSNRMQIQMIKTHPIKWAIAKSVNTAIGFAETVLPWLILDDDDRKNYLDKYFSITPYLRYSNLIMGFGGELVTIPLPPAFIPSHTLGVCMAEMVLRNNEPGFDPTALVIDVANAGANEWLPEFIVDPVFDIANRKDFVISSIVPAQLKPFAEIYDNRNFFGSPIYNDNINEFKPAYQRIYNGTGPTYVNISQTLNNWTGGNEVDRGFIQLNPAILEHLIEGYVSGLGKFGEKAFTTLSGNAESSKDIPVLGRFWRGDIEYYLDRDEKNTYYRLLKQAEEYRYRRNEYRKLNGYESEKEELNKEGELYEPILIQIRKLNRYKRLEKNTSDPKKKEKYKNKQNEVYKKVQQIEEEYNNKKFNQ